LNPYLKDKVKDLRTAIGFFLTFDLGVLPIAREHADEHRWLWKNSGLFICAKGTNVIFGLNSGEEQFHH